MKPKIRRLWHSCIFTAAAAVSGCVMADTVRLTSLYWPPYTGKELVQQGASVAVAKAAFDAMGHQLEVDFFPWNRAVSLAKSSDYYVGYFPAYYFKTNKLLLSEPMGSGMLGLVENVDKPIRWRALTDLVPYTIGVVSGYRNTREFDEMIHSGQLEAQESMTDTQNALKVASFELDLAVIDENVLRYLRMHDPEVSQVKEKLQLNKKPLVYKDLYIAFTRGPEGERWLEVFNQGLGKIDADQIMRDYMDQHFKSH
ncbi:substrate-binding periplasmic protein [Vibrio nigripulchritudo]|uniref:substrate-binding periplasmic protein n=1 Tax=Vibrio nigripulchritudo TaxID=28173 RepID=UPI0005FA73C1|nr:transporter substrate-binding domain-containing protein [Vibrio nigripulchritudo]KJY76865.1 ABC transporter [Vibrio nigripulchritudo]